MEHVYDEIRANRLLHDEDTEYDHLDHERPNNPAKPHYTKMHTRLGSASEDQKAPVASAASCGVISQPCGTTCPTASLTENADPIEGATSQTNDIFVGGASGVMGGVSDRVGGASAIIDETTLCVGGVSGHMGVATKPDSDEDNESMDAT